MYIDYFNRIHTFIASGRELVDDKTASVAPELFDTLKQVDNTTEDAPLIKAGTRINWSGTLKRATVDLWDTRDNNPDNAPLLWEDVAYKMGNRIIPEVITAGLAFAENELGWWSETLYRSKIANNVWTPEQYPDGWEEYNDSL